MPNENASNSGGVTNNNYGLSSAMGRGGYSGDYTYLRQNGGGFGGSKSQAPGAPVNGPTANGHQGMSTYGGNDYTRLTIDGGGGSGWVAAAIAALQFGMAIEQYNIAKSYYNKNKTDFDFYQNYYQPKFTQHKNDAFSQLDYVQDYNLPVGGMLGRVKVYDEKWFQTRRRLHRYAVGLGQHTDYTFYMLRRRAALAGWVAGRRVEDARKDWKDDQYFTHKVQALNFGITAGNIARQGLAQATSTLMGAYEEMGSRIGGFANGLSKFSGYQSGGDAASRMLQSASSSGVNIAPRVPQIS